MLSNPLRYAFDKASQAATQCVVGDPDKPAVDEDDEPGLEGRDFYSPAQSTYANGMHAVVVETDAFEARALQHEIDHCAGLLFLDRVAGAHALHARQVYLDAPG